MPAYPAASSPVATIEPVRPDQRDQRRRDEGAADDAGEDHRQRDAVGAGEDLLVQLPLQRGLAEHLDQDGPGAADHRPAPAAPGSHGRDGHQAGRDGEQPAAPRPARPAAAAPGGPAGERRPQDPADAQSPAST